MTVKRRKELAWRRRLAGTGAQIAVDARPADPESYRGERASFLAGVVLMVSSSLAILWVASLWPFKVPSFDSASQTGDSDVLVDARIDCPFEVMVSAVWFVDEHRGLQLSLNFTEPRKVASGFPPALDPGRLAKCNSLDIDVKTAHPLAFTTSWSKYVAAADEPGHIHVLMDSAALGRFAAQPEWFFVAFNRVVKATSYSEREFVVTVDARTTFKGELGFEMWTDLTQHQEVKSIVPKPFEVERTYPDYFFRSESVGIFPNRRNARLRVSYIDLPNQREEGIWNVFLPALLGIGAAGVFQSFVGFVGKYRRR